MTGVIDERKSLLLHVCCGPCATQSVRRLSADYAVTGFFSNSNVHPSEEYRRRADAARRMAERLQMRLIEDVYDHDAWLKAVHGHEAEPEGGARCALCFRFNLGRTAAVARERGFDLFTTTLTISPHKSSALIFRVGRQLGPFLEMDFKKQDGFRKSVALSREYGLYRQSYCGCEFSRTRD